MRNSQDLSGYGQERDDEPHVERLPHCEYGVPADNEEGGEDCGEPAVCRVRWGNGDWLHLCEARYLKLRP